MRLRPLGRTGVHVSELAIAVSPGGDPGNARATVALALAHGVNAATLDAGDAAGTALLGDVFADAGRRDLQVIARPTSLVAFDLPSPHVHAGAAYPGRHLRAETERLLAALGVERLALLQLHAWCPEWLGEGDWLETLERLRGEGKIAGFGVSLFDHDVDAAREIVASGAIDAVQLMYNVFDQGAAAALLPRCAAQGVGVVARSPLYYGALTPGLDERRFMEDDWRGAYFYDAHRRETVERTRRLADEVAAPDRSVADLALRFALSAPVATVALGMHRPAHLLAALEAVAHGPLDEEQAAALAVHRWLCA